MKISNDVTVTRFWYRDPEEKSVWSGCASINMLLKYFAFKC